MWMALPEAEPLETLPVPPSAPPDPLVSALQNISRARFRRASSALQSALRTVSELDQHIRPSAESRPQPAPASMRVAA